MNFLLQKECFSTLRGFTRRRGETETYFVILNPRGAERNSRLSREMFVETVVPLVERRFRVGLVGLFSPFLRAAV